MPIIIIYQHSQYLKFIKLNNNINQGEFMSDNYTQQDLFIEDENGELEANPEFEN